LQRGRGQEKTMSKIHNNRVLKERRVELRRKETPTEEKLWFELRNNKLGAKFKRQHSVGGYILDFYCAKKKLIIELDGEVHNSTEAKEYDAVRDKFFRELGYKTVRFLNREVENDIEKVLERISKNL
jgi:very-short-patch-repair endonuclease